MDGMRLEDHPGFFGITSQGVIAIHADWPMYPEEHGADLALLWLTALPQGTRFKRLDDIDRCNLFIADVKCTNRANAFDERNLHVAVWHEDLLELRKRGFVEGVSPVSERRWQELRRAEFPSGPLYVQLGDGTFEEVQFPCLAEYDDDDLSWPEFSMGDITVTATGRAHVASVLSESTDDFAILGLRIQPLLELGFFDSAVREACIGLENRLKTWLTSDRWGDPLVEEFMARLCDVGDYPNTHMRVLRNQIRTAFKFIRNDFMHNFVDVDETQCRALLFRLARVQTAIDHITNGA
jgi:hypothetical protein